MLKSIGDRASVTAHLSAVVESAIPVGGMQDRQETSGHESLLTTGGDRCAGGTHNAVSNSHRPNRKQRLMARPERQGRCKPPNKSHSSDNKFSRLIDNLSEFLAARHSDNRYDCYSKFCNAAEAATLNQLPEQVVDNSEVSSSNYWQPLQIVSNNSVNSLSCNNCCSNANNNLFRPYSMATYATDGNHLLPAPAGYHFKTKQISKSASIRTYHRRPTRTKRRRVSSLLAALFDPRKQLRESRASLLISLLRAPIVLAALFSLALCISLIILYGLTYLQQHNALHSFHRFYHISSHCGTQETTSDHLQRHVDELFAGSNATTWTKRQVPAPVVASDSIRVPTECGSFEGRRVTIGKGSGRGEGETQPQVAVFKGIPYASPPVGARRWTRPRPVWLDKEHLCKDRNVSWRALEERSHCSQLSPFLRRYTGSEDCLYLDIYAPITGRAEVSIARESSH